MYNEEIFAIVVVFLFIGFPAFLVVGLALIIEELNILSYPLNIIGSIIFWVILILLIPSSKGD